MSLWANLKNYFFGIPLKKEEPPVVENKLPEPPKNIDLQIKEIPPQITVTVETPTIQLPHVELSVPAPQPEEKPKKKVAKPAGKKTSTKKKS